MGYRVGELATAAGVSVELVRSYQSKGLLPPPRHRGRIALYGERHLERLRVIRDLKARGYSLRAIAGVLDADGAREREGPDPLAQLAPASRELLTLGQIAQRSGVPPGMLRSLEASGVIRSLPGAGGARYTEEDVAAIHMLLQLIGTGLPLEEFLTLARGLIQPMETAAAEAVSAFRRYGLEIGRSEGGSADGAARDAPPRSVPAEAALERMVHAATYLLAYHFERMLRLAAAGAGAAQPAPTRGRPGRQEGSEALPA